MTRLLCFATFLSFAGPLAAQDASKGKDAPKDELAREVLKLTNEERAKEKRAALKANDLLTKAARQHVEELAKQNNAQQAADGNATMERLKTLVKAVGYRFAAMGENIGFGHQTGEDVVALWMKNNVHRENILSPRFTQVGVASAKAADGTVYFVQIFAAPARR